MLRNDLFRPWFVGEKDWGFEIIDGEYTGVVVQIEEVNFSTTDPNSVELNFHVVRRPENLADFDTKDELFVKTVDLIINDILKEAVEDYEQNRNGNTKESNP